jgi:IclR family acetate operon transcriptional repressor
VCRLGARQVDLAGSARGEGSAINDEAPTRAVGRALALLATVCGSDAPSLTECARSTGLPTSTALRLLRTLEQADFVTRDDDGTYRAGPHLVQLGARAFAQQSVVEAARPALTRLVEATGESAYLSVRGPGETALYVASVEGTHSVRHTSWTGRTGPLADSAVGAVLTGRVPAAGFVTRRSVIEPDVTAIAAPVVHDGGILAALSVVGPVYRIDDATAARYGRQLAEEAAHVSATLVGSPAPGEEKSVINR